MRKAQAKKLPLAPDPKFNDKLVTRFVNNLMWNGKKSGAYDIFYNALEKVAKTTGEDGYEVWKKALANITPSVEVRSRRIGGATFQIPSEVRPDRKISLSIKWMVPAIYVHACTHIVFIQFFRKYDVTVWHKKSTS